MSTERPCGWHWRPMRARGVWSARWVAMPASPATPSKHILFAPFDLDLRAGLLRRAGTLVALRPKTFSVLVHLAEHPGELVTKQGPARRLLTVGAGSRYRAWHHRKAPQGTRARSS